MFGGIEVSSPEGTLEPKYLMYGQVMGPSIGVQGLYELRALFLGCYELGLGLVL